MSKDYVIFDKNADSVTVASLKGFREPFCGAGKNLLELGFGALEDARLSRALSMPLVEEFLWQSSCDGGGENGEEIDALIDLEEEFESTREASKGCEIELTRERVRRLFKILRDVVGPGERIDAVDVLEQTIRYIKKLQMELRCHFQ